MRDKLEQYFRCTLQGLLEILLREMATGKFKLIDADQENFDKIMAAAGR